MKVELSIKDDKELRDLIKDMIRGQVTSIVRYEIKKYTTDALEKALSENLAKIAPQEIQKRIRQDMIMDILNKAISNLIKSDLEMAIYERAYKMMKRDDAQIEKLIDKKLRNIQLNVKL